MPAQLGDTTGPGDTVKTFADAAAGEALTAGDVVAIDQSDGDIYQADSNVADQAEFAGVVPHDYASGDSAPSVVVEAPGGIVANVDEDGTLTAGERVGVADSSLAGEDAGEFVVEVGGPALLLSDPGGTTADGRSLATGEGEVSF